MLVTQTSDKSVDVLTATIASGQTTSSAFKLYGCTAAQFETPAAFTGTSITFEVSIDKGATFKAFKDSNNVAIAYTVSVDGIYTMDKNIFSGIDEVKFVASSQGADRTIKLKTIII